MKNMRAKLRNRPQDNTEENKHTSTLEEFSFKSKAEKEEDNKKSQDSDSNLDLYKAINNNIPEEENLRIKEEAKDLINKTRIMMENLEMNKLCRTGNDENNNSSGNNGILRKRRSNSKSPKTHKSFSVSFNNISKRSLEKDSTSKEDKKLNHTQKKILSNNKNLSKKEIKSFNILSDNNNNYEAGKNNYDYFNSSLKSYYNPSNYAAVNNMSFINNKDLNRSCYSNLENEILLKNHLNLNIENMTHKIVGYARKIKDFEKELKEKNNIIKKLHEKIDKKNEEIVKLNELLSVLMIDK